MNREQTITVWDGGVRMRVLSAGSGPALVFLHGPWGLAWDSFLDDLARSFTVYAPEHPGTTPEEAHDDIYRLDGLWDLILCHDELLTALKIEEAVVVGHSFGGMVACELAAAYPRAGNVSPPHAAGQAGVGPGVRIRLAPARSLQTISSSAADPSLRTAQRITMPQHMHRRKFIEVSAALDGLASGVVVEIRR